MQANPIETHALSSRRASGQALGSGVYAIVDGDALGWPAQVRGTQLDDLVAQSAGYALAALQAGAVALQLRYKSGSATARVACARAIARVVANRLPFVVNDDIAVALSVGIGLHLGQLDADPVGARRELGDRALLGWSTHDLAQVEAADRLPVDYLGFGPVRATASKLRPDPVTGWAMLADACARTRLPIVAIGGLDWQDAAIARSAGAHALAVIGSWLRDGDRRNAPEQACAALARIAQAWQAG